MDDEAIIALFFARSEQAIQELDEKYGKVCHSLAYNILHSRQDAEECVNDAYLGVWDASHRRGPIRCWHFCAESSEKNFHIRPCLKNKGCTKG